MDIATTFNNLAMAAQLLASASAAYEDDQRIDLLEMGEIAQVACEALGYAVDTDRLETARELIERVNACAKDGVLTVTEMFGTLRWIAGELGYDFDSQGVDAVLFPEG